MRIGGMRSLALGLVSVVVLAVCGAPAGSGQLPNRSDGGVAPSPSGTPQTARSTAPGATGSAVPATAARAAFLSYSFTDVRDGKQFKLSDFAGKPVLVIGMAVW